MFRESKILLSVIVILVIGIFVYYLFTKELNNGEITLEEAKEIQIRVEDGNLEKSLDEEITSDVLDGELDYNNVDDELKVPEMIATNFDNIGITITSYENIFLEKEEIVFEVIFGTHSVDLDKYITLKDYLSIAVDDTAIPEENVRWVSEGGGHHFSGLITIINQYEGGYYINNESNEVNVIIQGIETDRIREHLFVNNKMDYND